MAGLGFLSGGDRSNAIAVSNYEAVMVGSASTADAIAVLFIWSEEDGMRGIIACMLGFGTALEDYDIISNSEFSANGNWIVGRAYNPRGNH